MSCPICSKKSEKSTSPFCSTRCKMVDLNRWLGGQYFIPGEDSDLFLHEGNEEEEDIPPRVDTLRLD